MGSAAGGVKLFAGGHEAGAHGSGILLAAGSYSDATQGGGGEGTVVLGEGEVGFGLPGSVVGTEAQVFMRLMGIDELAGIQVIRRDPRCA